MNKWKKIIWLLTSSFSLEDVINNLTDDDIYDQQKQAVIDAMEEILENKKTRIIILAEPQSGKTGVAKIFKMLFEHYKIKVCILSGMNNKEMKKQIVKDTKIDDKDVYFNQDIQREMKSKNNKEFIKKFSAYNVIMNDESHYGENKNGTLDKFYNDIGVGSTGKINNKNVHVVINISATPMAELH